MFITRFAVALCLSVTISSEAKYISPASRGNDGEETKTLNQLYADALREGCNATIYAGGDTSDQQDYYKNLFARRFPGCNLEFIVDYSKFHDARINYQISQNRLIPDVVQLQTLQVFPRLKQEGRLLNYKPRGWRTIINDYKDFDGAYVGIYITVFTNCINKNLMPNSATWPRDIMDYLRPEFRGHITLTYPNDDDAVLFLFKLLADKHGWGFLRQLKDQQDVTWVRGTQEPSDALDAGRTWAGPAVACDMNNRPESPSAFVLPRTDPFMSWPQTAAIFRTSKKPATSKLYLNWILDPETQKNDWTMWSTRSDVSPPTGFGPISSYRSQTNPTDFKRFMENRALVEEVKTIVTLIIGEPQGEPSPGNLGLFPTKARHLQ